MMRARRLLLLFVLCALGATAQAQQLLTRFACSLAQDDQGQRITFADTGTIDIDGTRIKEFSWESSLFRSTHGFDCSIDMSDQLQAEVRDDGDSMTWRVAPVDGKLSRWKRGYDTMDRTNCTIRLIRTGNKLQVKPTCPAMCGSRENFSTLEVDLKTGVCRYE